MTGSLVILSFSLIANFVFLIFTRNYDSQDFFKNDAVLIFFKIFANLSFLLVCILQFFIFYFFVEYTLRIYNASIFYDILNYKNQAYFYGKL
jgi:hypothetical protein